MKPEEACKAHRRVGNIKHLNIIQDESKKKRDSTHIRSLSSSGLRHLGPVDEVKTDPGGSRERNVARRWLGSRVAALFWFKQVMLEVDEIEKDR